MKIVSKFSVAATLAFLVVSARPDNAKKSQNTSSSGAPPSSESSGTFGKSSHQKQLSQEQKNQQSVFDPGRVSDSELKKTVKEVNKASTFIGMAVQNLQNEKLGKVNDLVFDPAAGKVSYAVVSVGGLLGVGDKLIAVPVTSLRPQPGQKYLVLNMTKDELRSSLC